MSFLDRILGRRRDLQHDLHHMHMHEVPNPDRDEELMRAREAARERENRLMDLEREFQLDRFDYLRQPRERERDKRQ